MRFRLFKKVSYCNIVFQAQNKNLKSTKTFSLVEREIQINRLNFYKCGFTSIGLDLKSFPQIFLLLEIIKIVVSRRKRML